MSIELLEPEVGLADRNARPAAERITVRIEETRGQIVRLRAGTRWLLTLAVALVLFGLLTAVDYYFELAWGARAAGLLVLAFAVIAFARSAAGRWAEDYTLSAAAGDVENVLTDFGQRLRTTVDYQRPHRPTAPASPTLLRALEADTDKLARNADFSVVVNARPLAFAAGLAALLGLVWLAAIALSGEWRIATGRSLLLPWHYTTVTFTPSADLKVKAGDSVPVVADIAGRPVESAAVQYRLSGSNAAWKTLALQLPGEKDQPSTKQKKDTTGKDAPAPEAEPATLVGKVAATLANVREDLEFAVVAGPLPLPMVHITVLQPLSIKQFEAQVTPPEYTGKPAESFPDWDLKVLEGSGVEFAVQLNRAAASAKLTPVRKSKSKGEDAAGAAEAPPAITVDGNRLLGKLVDLRKTSAWELTARTADGIELKPQRLSIRVQADGRAKIRFVEPNEELVVIPTAEVPFAIEGGDDLALLRVGIAAQVGDGPLTTIWQQEFTGGTSEPVRGATQLALEEFQLTHQDAVTYHAFADDRYFDGERRTTTPLRFIDIRPFKIAYQMVEGGGSCKGCSTTLEELIARQRQNLTMTFTANNDQEHSSGMKERLSKYENEIAVATKELSDGLAQRGQFVPELQNASQAMLKSVAELSQDQWDEALLSEQQALKELIRARQNIRKMLSQPNSPSASACRKFDRQLRQKLRTPEEMKKDRQQQLAQTRQELNQLAKNQRQWSEELNPPNSGQNTQQQQSQNQQQQQQQQQQSQSNSQSSSSSQTSSSSSSAQQQQQAMLDKLKELRQRLAEQQGNTPAGEESAELAEEAMRQGKEDAAGDRPQDAAQAGKQAADQLEELADHLANMGAEDLGERLKRSQQLAERLAAQQQEVSEQLDNHGKQSSGAKSTGQKSTGEGSSSQDARGGEGQSNGAALTESQRAAAARRERALTAETQMLHEQLSALRADSSAESGDVARDIEDATSANPPDEIADQLREAAGNLDADQSDAAANAAQHAARQLETLAADLKGTRARFAQPQLEELLELEAQVAELQRRLRAAGNEAERESLAEQWQQLEARLDRLASGDERLAQALEQLRNASNAASQSNQNAAGGKSPIRNATESGADSQMPQGHGWLRLSRGGGELKDVAKALQVKIQEAILSAALQDADEPVPPAYRQLVDEYYQALSDDLR